MKVKPLVYSFTYYKKKWLARPVDEFVLNCLHPLYASIYISTFYRLLAKVGKNSEISTASDVTSTIC
jgi:hypothetical protein